MQDGNLVISANGGIPDDPCYLLTSTNLASLLSSWSCVATNYFNLSGGANLRTPLRPAHHSSISDCRSIEREQDSVLI
jgi:hypothetical protein